MLNFGGVFLSLKKNASPPKPNTTPHQPTTAKPPGCEDTQEPVALLRSRLLEANIPEVLSAMEVKTRPISTQALVQIIWGAMWFFWVKIVKSFETKGDVFFVAALGFFLGNENYSLIETEGNKNLCVLTKLSTFKHPVFSSSAGGYYRCFGKTRARFYSVLKRVECCWVRS